jgi:hypothetical protein
MIGFVRIGIVPCLSLLLASCAARATFPPEGVDHLSMQVTLDVEIFGIGKDTITLEGSVVVHRSGPQGADGKTMTGDMVGASLSGESKVFGPVVATRNPSQPSPCSYTYEGPGKYRGHFDIQGWFWLKQHDLMVYTSAPVRVEGPAAGIPPVGQQAALVTKDVPLHDLRRPGAQPIGTLHDARGTVGGIASLAAR